MVVTFVVMVGLFVGQLAKGATGFGSALIALPILGTVLEPAQALLVVAVSDVAMGAYLGFRARRLVLPWVLGLLLIPAIAMQGLGTALLLVAPANVLRLALAAFVGLFALKLLVGRVVDVAQAPVPRRGVVGQAIGTGAMMGLLSGSVGTPGPPAVWFVQRNFDGPVGRAQLLAVFLPLSIVLLATLTASGAVAPADWGLAAWGLVASMAGGVLGAWLAPQQPSRIMPRVVGGLMALCALLLIIAQA